MYIYTSDRREVDVWNVSKSESSGFAFYENKLTVDLNSSTKSWCRCTDLVIVQWTFFVGTGR